MCRGRHGHANLRGHFPCVFPTYSGRFFTCGNWFAWVFMGVQTSGDNFVVFFQRILAIVSPLISSLHDRGHFPLSERRCHIPPNFKNPRILTSAKQFDCESTALSCMRGTVGPAARLGAPSAPAVPTAPSPPHAPRARVVSALAQARVPSACQWRSACPWEEKW